MFHSRMSAAAGSKDTTYDMKAICGYWETIACLLRQLIRNGVFGTDEEVTASVEEIRVQFNSLLGPITNKEDNLKKFANLCTKDIPELITKLKSHKIGDRLDEMTHIFKPHLDAIKASVDVDNQTRLTAEHFFFALTYAADNFAKDMDEDTFREEVSNLGLAIGAMNFVISYELKNIR